ncbi:MAG: ice-binding family protein [Rhodoglobus sp.]
MTAGSASGTRERRAGASRWGHRGALFSGAVLGAGLLIIGPLGALSAQAAVPVLLGTAGSYAVLGATPNLTNTGPSTINGDVGISPANSLVGFGGPPNATVNGVQHAGDAVALQAQADLIIAYDQAALMPSTNIATQLGGTAPVPGAYTDAPLGGGLDLTGTITLDGGGSYDSVWVFQSTSSLITAGTVSLINGAQACNVYWQVTSSATLGPGTSFAGTILALTSITVDNAITVEGRLLARNGTVTLINDTINRPDTCLTGPVAGGGGPVVVPPVVPAAGAPAGGAPGAGALGRLALSGSDSWIPALWGTAFIAIGIATVAMGRRLTPRGAHRIR